MNLIEAHKPYTNDIGFISPNNPPIEDQNGIRWTAQYIHALNIHNQLTPIERMKAVALFQSCEQRAGLLARTPENKGGQEGWDDIVARISVDSILKTSFAQRFLDYGNKHCYFYLTDSLTFKNLKSAFLLRYPHLFTHALFATDKKPNKLLIYYWNLAMKQAADDSKSQDGKVLMWMMKETYKASLIKLDSCEESCEYFEMKLKEQWGGIGQVLEKYWGNGEHPTIKALRNIL